MKVSPLHRLLSLSGLWTWLLISIFNLSLTQQAKAQGNIPIGSWRTHLSYSVVNQVEIAGETVYAATAGGLFTFDTDEGSIRTFSKLDGFSEANISAIKWDEGTKTLVVAYASGNIDLLSNNRIRNNNAIVRANITGSKRINHIAVHRGIAYLSTDFGLVTLNISRNEIRESNQQLSRDGGLLRVNATTILEDSLFLATAEGLKGINLNRNLQNSANYTNIVLNRGLPQGNAQTLEMFNGELFVAFQILNSEGQPTIDNGVYRMNMSTRRFGILNQLGKGTFRSMNATNSTLLICTNTAIGVMGANLQPRFVFNPQFRLPTDATLDAQGHIYVGDVLGGLMSDREGEFKSYIPNGPLASTTFRLKATGGKIIAAAGSVNRNGYSAQGNRGGYAIFENGEWRNVTPDATPNFTGTDILDVTYNPFDKNYYVATYGNGVFIDSSNGRFGQITESSPVSSQLTSLSEPPANRNLRITSVNTDANGDVWMTNFGSVTTKLLTAGLHRYQPRTKTMTAYPLTGNVSSFTLENAMNHIITPWGDKWVQLEDRRNLNNGFFNIPMSALVFNERANTNNQWRLVSNAIGSGRLPSEAINDIALDSRGNVWLAMNRGIGVFYNASGLLRATQFNISLPIITGRPVLENDRVTALAIDGADRVWAAAASGVYVFDKDITRIENFFSAENSPLLSNNVTDIAIEPKTGEVFFATDLGIISYRSEATSPGEGLVQTECVDVTVFPNPVRPDFQGLVSITGVPSNSIVKITDVSGKKIWEARSTGTTLAWNRRDYNGVAAKTGIYLVFISTEDGQKGCTTKIAVVE